MLVYLERQLFSHFYLLCIILDLRSFKAAGRTFIIPKLTVMVKTVFQLCTTFFTETPLSDFICCAF